MFLLEVGAVLIVFVLLVGWGSTYWPFTRLEPAFIGALVGASGTIFAACVAYTAARQNLEMAQMAASTAARQRIEFEEDNKRSRKQQATRELQETRDLKRVCDGVIGLFAGASENGPRDYFVYMVEAIRDGSIVYYNNIAPGPLGVRAREALQRFYNVRGSVEQANNRNPGRDIPERAELNRAIRDRLNEVVAVRDEVAEDIRRRERALDELPSGQ